jgi:hypothetical protein
MGYRAFIDGLPAVSIILRLTAETLALTVA